MIPLDDFWNHLVYRPGLAALPEEWSRCLGETGWATLRRDLFVVGEIATSFWRADDKHEFHIRKMADGTYAWISALNGTIEREGLKEQQVRNMRINVNGLRDRIAQALGIQPDPGRVSPASFPIPVGRLPLPVGVEVATFMILPPTRAMVAHEVQRLVAQSQTGIFIFVPMTIPLEAEVLQYLETHRARVLPLNELISCDAGGTFQPMAAWETFQNAYLQKHFAERMVPAPPRYEFRKIGDHWTVRFDRVYTTINEAVGNHYIALLLASPNRKIFAPDLLCSATGEAATQQTGSAGDQADKKAIEDAKDHYVEMSSELERAKRDNDLATQSRLESEIVRIGNYLKTVKGLGGRGRQAADDADKIRRAMTQAIGRTIRSLKGDEKLPEAARHLENAIKTGLFMSYEPEKEVPWSL